MMHYTSYSSFIAMFPQSFFILWPLLITTYNMKYVALWWYHQASNLEMRILSPLQLFVIII